MAYVLSFQPFSAIVERGHAFFRGYALNTSAKNSWLFWEHLRGAKSYTLEVQNLALKSCKILPPSVLCLFSCGFGLEVGPFGSWGYHEPACNCYTYRECRMWFKGPSLRFAFQFVVLNTILEKLWSIQKGWHPQNHRPQCPSFSYPLSPFTLRHLLHSEVVKTSGTSPSKRGIFPGVL